MVDPHMTRQTYRQALESIERYYFKGSILSMSVKALVFYKSIIYWKLSNIVCKQKLHFLQHLCVKNNFTNFQPGTVSIYLPLESQWITLYNWFFL